MWSVIDIHPAADRLDESCTPKLAEVVAGGGLGETQGFRQVAAILLAGFGAEEVGHDLHASGVGDGFQAERDVECIFVTDRPGRHGCATHGCRDVDGGQRFGHEIDDARFLTYIKVVAHYGGCQ